MPRYATIGAEGYEVDNPLTEGVKATKVHETSGIAAGGSCKVVSVSGTSAQSAALDGVLVHITPTVDCFMREGAAPTAVSDGTDEIMIAYVTQAKRITRGNKLAFKTTGAAGSVYIAIVD